MVRRIEQVRELIEQELRREQDLTNVNGLDLTICLITPIKEAYLSINSEEVQLWTVLRENMEGKGYFVFYDDRKLQQGGRLLDIAILDHLIVSKDAFYSFADEGII